VLDEQSWPVYDPTLIIDETVALPVQINGKVRATISISPDLDEVTVIELATQEDQIKKYLDGNQIKKVIYVQGRILNIVV
jgi:leucyl-tRNA synthetase